MKFSHARGTWSQWSSKFSFPKLVITVANPFFVVFLGLKLSSVTGFGVNELDVNDAESEVRYWLGFRVFGFSSPSFFCFLVSNFSFALISLKIFSVVDVRVIN